MNAWYFSGQLGLNQANLSQTSTNVIPTANPFVVNNVSAPLFFIQIILIELGGPYFSCQECNIQSVDWYLNTKRTLPYVAMACDFLKRFGNNVQSNSAFCVRTLVDKTNSGHVPKTQAKLFHNGSCFLHFCSFHFLDGFR